MKLKYSIYCVIIFSIGLLLNACEGFLDEDPKGKLTPETFFSTQEELEMGTYALYRKICDLQKKLTPLLYLGKEMT